MADIPASTETNTTLPLGRWVSELFEGPGDHDWFRLALHAGERYYMRVGYGSPETWQIDRTATLRDAAGNVIVSNTGNMLTTHDGVLDYVAAATDTYYLDANDQGLRANTPYVAALLKSFDIPELVSAQFGAAESAGGWNNDRLHPRLIGDVNGDGVVDIVGFGDSGVHLGFSVGHSTGFATAAFGASQAAGGWSDNNRYPRLLGDVSGDGTADIVGFAEDGVYVAQANKSGIATSTFGSASHALAALGAAISSGGWADDDRYPRVLGDIDDDGRDDIVAFAEDGVYVALAATDGTFGDPVRALDTLGASAAAGGWISNTTYPRLIGDVNGDGFADIVGFAGDGTYVALGSAGSSFARPYPASTAFGANAAAGGWSSNDLYPRQIADVNTDGRADIIAFAGAGVYVALAQGDGHFESAKFHLAAYGADAGGWTSDNVFPRALGYTDVNDHHVDIIGFGAGGALVSQNLDFF